MSAARALGLAACIAAAGCAGGDSAASCTLDSGGGHPTWANFGESFFLTYCDACHAADSPNRFGAPLSVTFDSEAELDGQIDAVRRTVLDERSMPLGGGLPDEDLAALDNYLRCRESPP